jgi:hypothetical protein
MPLNKSWHDYNESLIERGRVLMDIGFLKSWNKEIVKMNKGKVGAPFEYSNSYIHFLAFIKIGFKISYRTVQGIVRGLSEYIRIEEMHFTHMRRRMLKVKPSIAKMHFENDKPIILIVDASGLTISKKGDYIEEKWIREKKEFIKLHISVDEESKKIVSFRITKGNVHDTKKFGQLVKEAAKKYDIDKVYGDKAYDNRKNFNILDDINAEPAISIRKNASTRSKGCPLRRDEVLLIKKKLRYDGWKQLKDTGKRWITEIVFSSLKRVLGEDLLSKKFKAQKVEAGLKVMLYNKFISL